MDNEWLTHLYPLFLSRRSLGNLSFSNYFILPYYLHYPRETMRLSISCDGCRQAKVKCVHDGHPPCRRCQRLNRQASCLLTDPRSSPLRPRKHQLRTPARSSPSSQPRSNTQASPSGLNFDPIATLSPATIICACDTYRKKFPVANFLHYPSLITDVSSNLSSVEPVFLASLLSLCARFLPDHHLHPGETYAEYARNHLAHRVFEGPSLYLAQSLVMIALYEWGSGRPYKAWMYSGMATYMIQSLLKTADDSMEHNPEEFYASQTQYEQLVRTYWCCFAQDCELSSGARQHFALSFRQISVPLPISDGDFNYGHVPPRRWMPADMSRDSPLFTTLAIDHGLTIVTRGFDIFVRILRFANESRRGQAFSTPTVTPSTQQTWQNLKKELDEWRSLQDPTVQYPVTSAQVHVAMGHGELFAYINLVYFMSVLFLYRDRVLSGVKVHSEDHGQGAPNIQEITSAEKAIAYLFEAAQNIGGILSALETSGAPVITPYAGFSVFVAAHINMYGTVSPRLYPGGQEKAEQEKSANFFYLERLCELWPVGNNWWRTVQEANRFYETARGNQENAGSSDGANPLALGGTLDEYGDIRAHQTLTARHGTSTSETPGPQHPRRRNSVPSSTLPTNENIIFEHHDLETEMLQWPFISEAWSSGFDTGFDSAWPSLG
ncbi:conserved hypothetical protein [Aspergillus terreus NIH2624]|uniref:Zn(2)-C6 fungal-type domain-containing protein n=1 Tax=Aspergillus terreus (strain NIH 2624 / FGSC A1156) TaxID=341663 RepID=Q0CJ44_ASPTN|nr:uncharacterized protein ATEG_06290 [Aspergillus terreus NIH2624]EAU32834.1 conserved hypothetical protein [Aspergillus terreus NIH2624]